MQKIPNEYSAEFNTVKGRARLIGYYGDSPNMFEGQNEDGEKVWISFSKERGIIAKTFQSNGWLRVNTYDSEGYAEMETFEGRWDRETESPSILYIDGLCLGPVSRYLKSDLGWRFILKDDKPYTTEIRVPFEIIKRFTSSGKLDIITNGN